MHWDGKCTVSAWLLQIMLVCYLHRHWSSSADHDGHFWGKSQLNIVGKRSVTKEL